MRPNRRPPLRQNAALQRKKVISLVLFWRLAPTGLDFGSVARPACVLTPQTGHTSSPSFAPRRRRRRMHASPWPGCSTQPGPRSHVRPRALPCDPPAACSSPAFRTHASCSRLPLAIPARGPRLDHSWQSRASGLMARNSLLGARFATKRSRSLRPWLRAPDSKKGPGHLIKILGDGGWGMGSKVAFDTASRVSGQLTQVTAAMASPGRGRCTKWTQWCARHNGLAAVSRRCTVCP